MRYFRLQRFCIVFVFTNCMYSILGKLYLLHVCNGVTQFYYCTLNAAFDL